MRAHSAPAAQNQGIVAGLPFVEALARRMAASMPNSIDIGDLMQDGVLGLMDARTVGRSSGPESHSVMIELQADCFAGIWAHHADRSRRLIEPGDIQEALGAAAAIGDDRIQKRTQGYVVPESFTHGTSEQRMRAFRTGFDRGDPDVCVTA